MWRPELSAAERDALTALFGAKLVTVPADAYGHDLPAMVRAVTPRTRVMFVANPNNPTGTLTTFKADLSYSFGATITPSVQYFSTWGSSNVNFYTSPGGPTIYKPNSSGVVAEIAYVPFGKPDSPIQWGNIRLAAQYVAYTQYNGVRSGASNNNALFLSVWLATHF